MQPFLSLPHQLCELLLVRKEQTRVVKTSVAAESKHRLESHASRRLLSPASGQSRPIILQTPLEVFELGGAVPKGLEASSCTI